MNQNIYIRQATPEDAHSVMEILVLAIEDIAFSLSGVSDYDASEHILEEFFTQKHNTLSYENILVCEDKDTGDIAGAICAYPAKKAKAFNDPFIKALKDKGIEPHVEVECNVKHTEEIYIDSLAVASAYRGRGIANLLIKEIIAKAKRENYKKVSLLVDTKKTKTQEYYHKRNFILHGKKIIANHEFLYMIYIIK